MYKRLEHIKGKLLQFFRIYSFRSSFSMSDRGLTELSAEALSQLQMVDTLDLSLNKLKSFPDVTLPRVTTLDVSENELVDVNFVTNFPNLQKLYIDGNPKFGVSHNSWKENMFCRTFVLMIQINSRSSKGIKCIK